MGGEGSIAGMISTIKNNNLLLRKYRQRRKKAFEKIADPAVVNAKKFDFKDISEEELSHFRFNLKAEIRREKRIRIAVYIVFLFLSILIIYSILRWMGF